MTTATTPDEFRALTDGLAFGDYLRFDDERWKVIAVDGDEVEVRPISTDSRDITTIAPASDLLDFCVYTPKRAFGARYRTVTVET
jgi:hypothetical protein